MYASKKFMYGQELIERINDDYHTYGNSLMTSQMDEALFSQLYKCRGKNDNFCVKALKDLLSLCDKDDKIARYVYDCSPPSAQYARYADWFRDYCNNI